MGKVGASTQHEVLQDLCTSAGLQALEQDGRDQCELGTRGYDHHTLNTGTPSSFPPSQHHALRGLVFRPEDTRPLCVAKCKNRILVNGVRVKLE